MAKGRKTGGRVAGTPNKLTQGCKDSILSVFSKLGGIPAMAAWARENQTQFYMLYGRLIPHEVVGPGAGGEHLVKTIVHEYHGDA
jgi:hypothetical protein